MQLDTILLNIRTILFAIGNPGRIRTAQQLLLDTESELLHIEACERELDENSFDALDRRTILFAVRNPEHTGLALQHFAEEEQHQRESDREKKEKEQGA